MANKTNMKEQGKKRFHIDVSGMNEQEIAATMTSIVEGTHKGLGIKEPPAAKVKPEEGENASLTDKQLKKVLDSD